MAVKPNILNCCLFIFPDTMTLSGQSLSENPWLADNIQSFVFINCPECAFKTKKENSFQDHAKKKHLRSFAFFEILSIKSEPPDSKSNEQSEIVSDLDLDDSQIGIDDYFETIQSDKTLEEIMFSEQNERIIIADNEEVEIGEKDKSVKAPVKEKEFFHLCNFCNESCNNLLELKSHMKIHEKVLPIAQFAPKQSKKMKNAILKIMSEEIKQKDNKHMIEKKEHLYECHRSNCKFKTKYKKKLAIHIESK
jgi:hypothetical protein